MAQIYTKKEASRLVVPKMKLVEYGPWFWRSQVQIPIWAAILSSSCVVSMIILQLQPVFQLQDLSETVPMSWEEEWFIQFEEVFILAWGHRLLSMWLRENKYVQSTGETDALQCKSKSMHWRHSVKKYRKEVWHGPENLEKLTAKVSHICRIKVYSVKILNLLQVRVDSGEDDGEAEREDEHGEVDDVDRPHPGFPGWRIFDDRLNQFGRSWSVRRIFRDFTRWHFRFRILSRAGKTLSGNRLFSEWFEHLQKNPVTN